MVEAAKGFFDEFPMERVEREDNPWHSKDLGRINGAPAMFSPDILANSVGRRRRY